MTIKEIIDLMIFPPVLKDVALLAVIMSIIQISPLKINPWDWLKSIADLPKRINDLSKELNNLRQEFYDDRAFRWRQMIISRAHRIEDGILLKKGEWEELIDTIDRYEAHCKLYPDFRNGYATSTIDYLQEEYKEVRKNNNYAPDARKVDK